jgi:hypothetical protein
MVKIASFGFPISFSKLENFGEVGEEKGFSAELTPLSTNINPGI